jgi:hypothetical protein
MGHQRTGDLHAFLLGEVRDAVGVPSRVDDDALAAARTTDEVDEVLHGADGHLPKIEIAGVGHAAVLHRMSR